MQNVIQRRSLNVLVATAVFTLWSGAARAGGDKVLVIYKPGNPEHLAPAYFLERESGAELKSCDLSNEELGLLRGMGYEKLYTFDTYMPAGELIQLVSNLSYEHSIDFVAYVKQGDTGYTKNSVLSPAVHSVARTSSFLEQAALNIGVELSQALQVLSSGLSQEPSVDGINLKNYWLTHGSSPRVFKDIKDADPKLLQEYIETGKHYGEKAESVAKYVAKAGTTVLEITEGSRPVKVAFASTNTDVLNTGKVILDQLPNVEVVIIETGKANFLDGISRYSIRIRKGSQLTADKIIQHLVATLPNESTDKKDRNQGGGKPDLAGGTVKGTAQEIWLACKQSILMQMGSSTE